MLIPFSDPRHFCGELGWGHKGIAFYQGLELNFVYVWRPHLHECAALGLVLSAMATISKIK